MGLRLRKTNIYDSCSICGADSAEMHHVRHLNAPLLGLNKVMGAMNRKQIPVCFECHRNIHNGLYDGARLNDIAIGEK